MINKIKLIFDILKILNITRGLNMKKGFKTSEFWLSLVAIGLQVWMAIAGFIPAEVSAWVIAIITIVWIGFRTIAKVTVTKKDDEIISEIEKILNDKGISNQ